MRTYVTRSGRVVSFTANRSFVSGGGEVISETLQGSVTPPTGSAGGPYSGQVNTAISITGIVAPGSDPNPTIVWTSNKPGSFADATALSTTFTPTTVDPSYTPTMTISSNDSADVIETAVLSSNTAAGDVVASPTFIITPDVVAPPSGGGKSNITWGWGWDTYNNGVEQ